MRAELQGVCIGVQAAVQLRGIKVQVVECVPVCVVVEALTQLTQGGELVGCDLQRCGGKTGFPDSASPKSY